MPLLSKPSGPGVLFGICWTKEARERDGKKNRAEFNELFRERAIEANRPFEDDLTAWLEEHKEEPL